MFPCWSKRQSSLPLNIFNWKRIHDSARTVINRFKEKTEKKRRERHASIIFTSDYCKIRPPVRIHYSRGSLSRQISSELIIPMRRIAIPRQQQDNQNSKRWSTSLIENHNNQEEQISIPFQSPYSKLLTNKLGIPKEKAFVQNLCWTFQWWLIRMFVFQLISFSDRACVATGFRSAQAATDW